MPEMTIQSAPKEPNKMKIGSCNPSATLSAKVFVSSKYFCNGSTVKNFSLSVISSLFLFSAASDAFGADCSVREKSISGSSDTLKKVWIEFDTFEKISNELGKKANSEEKHAAFLYWSECFYWPWFNAWKAGTTNLTFDQARTTGFEPMETCTSWKTCGPRPDWRTPKRKAAEEAVLKARKN